MNSKKQWKLKEKNYEQREIQLLRESKNLENGFAMDPVLQSKFHRAKSQGGE